MAGGCAWSRRVALRQRTLRGLVRDTQKELHDVNDILHFDPDISEAVQDIGNLSSRCAALVIFGRNQAARARLVHSLLGRSLLPQPMPRGCRWLKIQYGSSTQVHLTLGNSEFELVEDLECNKRNWETLPLQDILRQDQTDLATMLEIEINNQFLKDGLKIIIPPDLDCDPGLTSYVKLKQIYSDFYNKRDAILKNFNPIYLYAIDRIGRNVFSESVNCDSKMISSNSDEDFWATFNLYYMASVNVSNSSVKNDRSDSKVDIKDEQWSDSFVENSVISSENCLDLHQIKEINPKAQVFFVLFSDSTDLTGEIPSRPLEATESTEENLFRTEELPESDQELAKDGVLGHTKESLNRTKNILRLNEEQIAFMNDLLDQWELMSTSPPKHFAKSQWSIVDDLEILRSTVENKALAPYLKGAIQNAGETLGKRCKREDDRRVTSRTVLLNQIVKFASDCCQSYLLEYCTKLSEMHVKLVQQLILASFDMARELQLVPKKIQYVAIQEQQLYQTINDKFTDGDKKQELLQIMQEVLTEIRSEINNMDWSVDDLPCHQDQRFAISNSVFYSSTRSSTAEVSCRLNQSVNNPTDPAICQSTYLTDESTRLTNESTRLTNESTDQTGSDVEEAISYESYNFDDYEIINSNDESLSATESYSRRRLKKAESTSPNSVIGAIRVENEAMSSMSSGAAWKSDTLNTNVTSTTCTTNTFNISVKQASLDVQQTVLSKLSRKISMKLVKFVDCLKDTYFGTLQRCLESLEASCRAELGGRPASNAMRSLVSVANTVDLQPCASFSVLRSLYDSIRRLFHKIRISSSDNTEACCVLSAVWRRRCALSCAHSLTPTRLARVISTQILERLSEAHERYQSALASLETALAGRLHHTEDVKLAIRKKYAPSFARLCLESTSMCDLLMYGTPELGREIGRGQYGVVYAVRGKWGGRSPVAVKSVLPADERHYHELAMEFFYTRSIPWHPRIVPLYGSVVQRSGSGSVSGGGACGVLLISARRARDLHAAVRVGLTLHVRMQIALDIVEGIRYLHSLGLVHRDIKMKNVLLDNNDRAALSDLGFCTAEALMSGSVVGTPVHMAPELQHGDYDASVDVYAFGILFWYLCAGNVKLPEAFEFFVNKEQLWNSVKNGVRPERLPHFSSECWDIMTSCWASKPSDRALLGDIQPKLQVVLQQALTQDVGLEHRNGDQCSNVSDDDSLDFNDYRPEF